MLWNHLIMRVLESRDKLLISLLIGSRIISRVIITILIVLIIMLVKADNIDIPKVVEHNQWLIKVQMKTEIT